MAKRPDCLFVLPWIATPLGGIDQVVLNLYRKFEDAGDFAPQILVTSWPHVQPLTTIEHGRSIAYMGVRSPVGWRRQGLMMRGGLVRWLVSYRVRAAAERVLRPLERRVNAALARSHAKRHGVPIQVR